MDAQKPQPKRRYQCFQLKFLLNGKNHACIAAMTQMPRRDVLDYLQSVAQTLKKYNTATLHKIIELIKRKSATLDQEDAHVVGFMSSNTISRDTIQSSIIPVVMGNQLQNYYADKPILIIGLEWAAFQDLKSSALSNDYWRAPPPSMN